MSDYVNCETIPIDQFRHILTKPPLLCRYLPAELRLQSGSESRCDSEYLNEVDAPSAEARMMEKSNPKAYRQAVKPHLSESETVVACNTTQYQHYFKGPTGLMRSRLRMHSQTSVYLKLFILYLWNTIYVPAQFLTVIH
jgi:hypothetical protein